MICNTYKMFFGTLADGNKLNILKALRKGPKSVTELKNELKKEQSCISHCLKKLKQLHFVKSKVAGKQRIYSIEDKTILPLLKLIDKHMKTYNKHLCKCTGEAKKKRWKR
jgi:ArsR family transcriptional regulator, zinc-responsive transcriptional repressor